VSFCEVTDPRHRARKSL